MMLGALGEFCATRVYIVKRDHLGEALHAVNGMGIQLTQRFARPGAHLINPFSEQKGAERHHSQKRHQHQRHNPPEIKQYAHHQCRDQHRHERRRHGVRKEILHEFDIVRRHTDHIARAPSHHVGRSQAVEFFKEGDAHLGQQPKGHVVRDPGLQPVKHPGDRRHNGKQNEQVHKRFTRLDGAHCQRPDHTDSGIGQYPRHPKTKGHH